MKAADVVDDVARGADDVARGADDVARAAGRPRVHKVGPHPEADGPHTSVKTNQGKVTGYTTYDATGNPVKRFRGEGRPHGDVEPPLVLEPKLGKGPGSPPKVPRKPRADELPRGHEMQ